MPQIKIKDIIVRVIMKKKVDPMARAAECIRAYRETGDETDVLGSYTGIFRDEGCKAASSAPTVTAECEVPVQDADDL